MWEVGRGFVQHLPVMVDGYLVNGRVVYGVSQANEKNVEPMSYQIGITVNLNYFICSDLLQYNWDQNLV